MMKGIIDIDLSKITATLTDTIMTYWKLGNMTGASFLIAKMFHRTIKATVVSNMPNKATPLPPPVIISDNGSDHCGNHAKVSTYTWMCIYGYIDE